MRHHLKRALGGVTVIAASSGAMLISPAALQAAPPGTPPVAPAVVTPATGTASTAFSLTIPNGAACPGDSASAGYRWSTFITPSSIDAATLTFDSNGPVAQAGEFTFPLFTPAGTPVTAKNTAPTTGVIVGQETLSLDVFAGAVPAGTYTVGYACYLGATLETYWSSPFTVAADGSYSANAVVGAAALAPTLDSAVAGDAQATIDFTAGASVPADIDYEITLTGGAAPITQTVTNANPVVITGLTNGTAYTVSVKARNSVGASAASNTLTVTPAAVVIGAQPPVGNLAAAPGLSSVALSWTAPASGPAPLSYEITTNAAGVGPFSTTNTTFNVTGLTNGVAVQFTVKAIYAAPDTGTPASVTAAAQSAQVLNQVIEVERPAGALILTQRCGVNGAVDGVAATVDQVGTAPSIDGIVGGTPDPEFANYPAPSPATYPTTCGLDLGVAELQTTGALAGSYVASGALNEVTVLDTRDTDAGWTVNGAMGAFTSLNDSFSGNYLGWTPVVQSTSSSLGYTQVATAGAPVAAGSGVSSGTGLADGQPLASAAAGAGLGIAQLDAAVTVVFPTTADAATYTGILALTIV
jgi:hypothetical protein